MPSLGNKSRTNHKQRYLRFIKTDRGLLVDLVLTPCSPAAARFLRKSAGRQTFEGAGKANPFPAGVRANQPLNYQKLRISIKVEDDAGKN
jgi:hypothetical protein